MRNRRALRIAVIGYGRRGESHVRVFTELDETEVSAVADLDRVRLDRIRQRYSHVRAERDYRTILNDPAIDAVVVAAPTSTHAQIASDALSAGKHVLVETPLCLTQWQAERLAELAESHRRVLMIGHTSVFDPGVNAVRSLIAKGELGPVHYLDAAQSSLGIGRNDANVLYDLGANDIALCNHLLGKAPMAVSAIGSAVAGAATQDVCFVMLQYDDGTFAHLNLSRLSPRKVRTLTAVGSKKTAHWDDLDPQDTLRIFDRGREAQPCGDSFGEFQYLTSGAEVRVPAIRRIDTLVRQAEGFVRWVIDGVESGCGVDQGLAVVATLEAANRSMRLGGTTCLVGVTEEPAGSARSDRDLAAARARCAAAKPGERTTMKHGLADARSIPRLPVPDPIEIERVRRRCGLQSVGASSLTPAAGARPNRDVMLKEASADVLAVSRPAMPELTEIERVRRRCRAEVADRVRV